MFGAKRWCKLNLFWMIKLYEMEKNNSSCKLCWKPFNLRLSFAINYSTAVRFQKIESNRRLKRTNSIFSIFLVSGPKNTSLD